MRALDQPHHRVVCAAQIDFELREQLVADRQIGIELERPLERHLGLDETLLRPGLEVLPHHVMDAPEARPRRRITADPPRRTADTDRARRSTASRRD